MSSGTTLVILGAIGAGVLGLGVWLVLRMMRANPEKRERKRRLELHRHGRLGDALITEATEAMLYYSYSVGGVQYEASQDVSALRDLLPPEPERLIGPAGLKYAPPKSRQFDPDLRGMERAEGSVPGGLSRAETFRLERASNQAMKKLILFVLPLAMFAADLAKEVRHELVMLPYYGVFDNLAYRVDGSKVTLFGQVRQPTLKTAAERAVKSIEGVSTVDNQIEVMPLSPNDDQIRMAVYRAIYSKPSLQRYQMGAVPPIHIIVKNGDVTLEGMVANQGDKDVANIAANGVSGVHKVSNNLRLDSAK